MSLVKICGLSDKSAVVAADEADYAGFIVGSPKSHRNISINKFNELKENLTHAKPVLVTVNHSLKFLHELRQFDDVIIQLHGFAREFVKLLDLTALGLNFEEFTYTPNLDGKSHSFITIDTTIAEGYGGTGESWNWKELDKKQSPVLVAGGINVDNVNHALSRTNADGVDVSSSMEIKKKKSPELISDFINYVRGLE